MAHGRALVGPLGQCPAVAGFRHVAQLRHPIRRRELAQSGDRGGGLREFDGDVSRRQRKHTRGLPRGACLSASTIGARPSSGGRAPVTPVRAAVSRVRRDVAGPASATKARGQLLGSPRGGAAGVSPSAGAGAVRKGRPRLKRKERGVPPFPRRETIAAQRRSKIGIAGRHSETRSDFKRRSTPSFFFSRPGCLRWRSRRYGLPWPIPANSRVRPGLGARHRKLPHSMGSFVAMSSHRPTLLPTGLRKQRSESHRLLAFADVAPFIATGYERALWRTKEALFPCP